MRNLKSNSKNSLEIEKIWNAIKDKTMDESSASELLISLIEKSKDMDTRINSIKLLKKLSFKSEEIYKTLESCLISDESYLIRKAVLRTIFQKFRDESIEPLRWVIQNDKSAFILFEIIKILEDMEDNHLNELMNERLTAIFNVVPEEARFFLDFTILHPEYFKETEFVDDFYGHFTSNSSHSVFVGSEYMYAINRGHVIALNLDNLSILPDSIGALSKLRHIYFNNCRLTELPESIGLLKRLRTLDLGWNNLVTLPNSLIHLKKILNFSLTSNFDLKTILEPVISIVKRKIALKYIIEGVREEEAFVLGLFEVLSGQKLEKASFLGDYDNNRACNYVINEEGNVIAIYIYGIEKTRIGIVPKQTCYFKHLEELILLGQGIETIPHCIRKINKLNVLDIS